MVLSIFKSLEGKRISSVKKDLASHQAQKKYKKIKKNVLKNKIAATHFDEYNNVAFHDLSRKH